MSEITTVPNQKIIKIQKEKCDRENLYATINLKALENAAQVLDAPAFKLWVYFSKNQNNYNFALSRQDVEETFGMKKAQYTSAINKLIEQGFLTLKKEPNLWVFSEFPSENEQEECSVVVRQVHDVVVRQDHAWLQDKTRNNTYNTYNNTLRGSAPPAAPNDFIF